MLGGRYRVLERLGVGGQGEVLAAEDTWCANLPVVLKQVAGAGEVLRREFAALRTLHHPALVEARDLATLDGVTYLIESRVDGGPLSVWAPARAVIEVVGALAGVAHALAHLHVRGLVHLDVSPCNILIEERGAILVDLGLARPAGRVGAVGTPGFVAPEVLAGEPATGASDVYSLAAALVASLGGTESAGWGRPDLAAIDDAEVRALLSGCLSDAPASRPSALALARHFAELAGRDLGFLLRPLTRLPLCGRAAELADFEQWLATGGTLLEVSGAPGAGKSAFIAACADRARLGGFTILSGDGDLAVDDLLGQALSAAPSSSTLIDEMGADLADLLAHPRLSQGRGRPRTARERAQLLVLALDLLARDLPVLAIIDGAEGATGALALALTIWHGRRVEQGARVVATCAAASFDLGPLEVEGVAEMLRLAYAEERPAAEAEHVRRVVGGLPGEVLAALTQIAQQGGTPLELDAGALATGMVTPLSGGLAALAAAAEPVSENVLRTLVVVTDDGSAALQQALREGAVLVDATAVGPRYRLSEAARRASTVDAGAHRLLAEALEHSGERLAAAVVWARAGSGERATLLLAAASDARPDDLLRALSAVAEACGGDALTDDLVETWARLAAAAGDADATARAGTALRAGGRDDAAAVLEGACLVKMGRYHDALAAVTDEDRSDVRAVRARALLFCGRAAEATALATAWEEASGVGRANLLDVLGHSQFALGEVDAARTSLERALVEAEAGRDRHAIARAQHALAIVLHRTGDLDGALGLYRKALAHADVLSRVSRTLNLAALLQDKGELVEARRLYTDALSRAVALANVREQARVGVNLANLHTQLGDLAAAVSLAEDTLDVCDGVGLEHAAAMAALVLAEAQLEREDTDAAAAALDRATGWLDRIDDQVAVSELALLRARVAAARGSFDEASLHLGEVDIDAGADHLQRQRAYQETRIALARGAPPDEALRKIAERAVALARDAGDCELEWRALALSHRVLDRGGHRRAAEVREQASTALDRWLASLPPSLASSYLGSRSRRELAAWIRQRPLAAGPESSRLGGVAYRRILAINRRLAREHAIEPLLELIVDAATELLGAERGFLLLRGGDGVRVAVARNFDRQSLEDGRQRISRSIANESLRVGEAILTTNAQEDQRFAGIQSVAALKVRSVICVPLRATERDEDPVIGALYLDHRFQDRAFNEDDVDLCESFADQAAIALENARLLEQTREQERRLAAQNERLERLNAQLQKEAAQYAAEAEAALRRLREEGPTVGVGRGFERIVGCSDKLREALRLVDRFADTDVPVVIYGESGTGKELVARAIHERSSRCGRAFVSINCGAIPENLIESELFGYKRGAFTGAVRDKAGLVQAAEGGTLLLDEIGEMPLAMQVKLLRVLQEKEVRPVGATASVRTDVRVLSASHEDLEALVASGAFREDLYYRLRVVEIPVPPLRDRREDIPLLVDHFCREITQQPATERFSEEALARLLGHDWPGNVRELENEVRRALALADGRVGIDNLSERLQAIRASGAAILADTARGSLRDITDGFEREVLLATLKRTGWNVRRAAKDLGLSRAALYTRLNKFGISREEHA